MYIYYHQEDVVWNSETSIDEHTCHIKSMLAASLARATACLVVQDLSLSHTHIHQLPA